MVQAQMNPIRHIHNEAVYGDFPVVYEDENLMVYTNGNGEIFIQPKNVRATVGIGPDGCGGLKITTPLVPDEVNDFSIINFRGDRPH